MWSPQEGSRREKVVCAPFEQVRCPILCFHPPECIRGSTLTATERTLCCVLENYQTPDGFRVPDVLLPFMHGVSFVPFVRTLVKGKLVDIVPPPPNPLCSSA